MRNKRRATACTAIAVACFSTVIAWQLTPAPAAAAEPAIPIRPGTALAKLVNEATPQLALFNLPAQRPKLDIPDWLRAHYLRNHTHILTAISATQANDPTGGLPVVLEDLYVWMLHNQELKPTPAPPTSPAAKAVSVGNNRLISGPQTTPRSESDIRIDPNSPKRIIAASNSIGTSRQSQFFS